MRTLLPNRLLCKTPKKSCQFRLELVALLCLIIHLANRTALGEDTAHWVIIDPKEIDIKNDVTSPPAFTLRNTIQATSTNISRSAVTGRTSPISGNTSPGSEGVIWLNPNQTASRGYLGFGYDSVSHKVKSRVLDFTSLPILDKSSRHEGEIDLMENASDYFSSLGISAFASANFGVASGSVAMSRISTNVTSDRQSTIVGRSRYERGQLILDSGLGGAIPKYRIAPEVMSEFERDGLKKWHERYGDSAITGLILGAQTTILATAKHTSSFRKTEFEASIKGSGWMGSVKGGANIRKDEADLKTSMRFTCALATSGASINENPLSFVDAFEKYRTFPSNAKKMPLDKVYVIGYIITPYAEMRGFPVYPSEFNCYKALAIERRLNSILAETIERIKNYRFLKSDLSRRGEDSQAKVCESYIITLDNLRDKIVNAYESAKENPFDRDTVDYSKFRLPDPPKELILIRQITPNFNIRAKFIGVWNHEGRGDEDIHSSGGKQLHWGVSTRMYVSRNRESVMLSVRFRTEEGGGDRTIFRGEKTLPIYNVPRGFEIVELTSNGDVSREHETSVGELREVAVRLPRNGCWRSLNAVLDSDSSRDGPFVGIKGSGGLKLLIRERR